MAKPITHSEALAELSPLLSNPTRLALVAGLHGCVRADFQTVKKQLNITDSTLSKHISSLEKDDIVAVDKGFVGKRARTWLSLSENGHAVYVRHMSALRQIAETPFAEAESEEPASA